MLCPKCGAEVPEGYLLCEKCGAEIKIVPDFEPELENSITEGLSSIVEELDPAETPEDPETPSEDPEGDPVDEFFRESTVPSKRILLFAGAGFLLLLILLVGGVLLYRNFSLSYQLSKAEERMISGDSEGALLYIARAKELRSDDVSILLKEADVHLASGMTQAAKDILIKIVNDKVVDREVLKASYDRLVTICVNEGSYEELQSLLSNCPDEDIRESYREYLVLPPEFSVPTGNYENAVELEISADAPGRIFFTLDESDPSDEHGILYTTPIRLNSGDYTLKAVLVSDHGIISPVAQSFYSISATAPLPPVVRPESGDYDKPFYVTVEPAEGVTVYYTKDKTVPSEENGILYTEPLNADMGTSNFSFVAVDENGKTSEVVSRSYNLYLGNVIPIPDAQNLLYRIFHEKGVTADLAGRYTDYPGVEAAWLSLNYGGVIDIGGKSYYLFYEYAIDIDQKLITNQGKPAPGRVYAVNAYTGEAFHMADTNTLLPL